MQTASDGFYETYRVSYDVNSARHDASQLMNPLA